MESGAPFVAYEEDEYELLRKLVIPSYIKCPLSLDPMSDPVMTVDGQVYERRLIEEWLASGKQTSPVSHLRLKSLDLVPVPSLKIAVEEWLSAQTEEVRMALANNKFGESTTVSAGHALRARRRHADVSEDSLPAASTAQRQAWRRLLYTAVTRGDAYVLRDLGKAGAPIPMRFVATEVDLVKRSVSAKKLEVLKLLAELGAPIDETSPLDGITPAHVAAGMGNVSALEMLAGFGASLSKRSTVTGVIPVHVAIVGGHVAAVEVLLRLGAQVDVAAVLAGGLPAHGLWNAPVEIAEALVRHRASVNHVGRHLDGQTPLHVAAHHGRLDLVDTLLRVGASPDAKDFYGNTPADTAISACRHKLAQRLDSRVSSPSCEPKWVVSGGVGEGGIIVRTECALDSPRLPERLAIGSVVHQVGAIQEHRLCFQKLAGDGPDTGWVSLRTKNGGTLLWRTHVEDFGEALGHQCRQLLDFTEPAQLPAKMTEAAAQWMASIRGAASEALACLGSSPSPPLAATMGRRTEISRMLREFHIELGLPLESNRLVSPHAFEKVPPGSPLGSSPLTSPSQVSGSPVSSPLGSPLQGYARPPGLPTFPLRELRLSSSP